MSEFPKKNELVIVKIRKINPYGAFCDLVEYKGIEGFIHISEVASKWIKSINQYLKEGEIYVMKVINIEKDKNIVDLSFRRVKEEEKRRRMEEYMNNVKSLKLIKAALKKSKSRKKIETILKKINELYETLYDFILFVRDEGIEIGKEIGLSDKVSKTLYELVQEAFKPKIYDVKKIFNITVYEPNGVDIIKSVLNKYDIVYIGGGKYVIEAQGENYKKINKALIKKLEQIKHQLKKYDAEFEVLK